METDMNSSPSVDDQDSNSTEESPDSIFLSQFPQFHLLPPELQCIVLYQAASLCEPRIITIHPDDIDYSLSHSEAAPEQRFRVEGINDTNTEALLQAGGKWKTEDTECEMLALNHAFPYLVMSPPLPASKFYFRPDKDILRYVHHSIADTIGNVQVLGRGLIKYLALDGECLLYALTNFYQYHHNTLSDEEVYDDDLLGVLEFIRNLPNLRILYCIRDSDSHREYRRPSNAPELRDTAIMPSDQKRVVDLWNYWIEVGHRKVDGKAPELILKEVAFKKNRKPSV